MRAQVDQLLETTELNCVVIDLKEYEGEVYLPGVKSAELYKTYVPAVPDLKQYLATLKERGVYTIARIVVFKDNLITKKKPEYAVRNSSGAIWRDFRGNTWLDPYSKFSWNYNLEIAEHAADIGFDEIQFDYIRFPSDGDMKDCRYSVRKSSYSASKTINAFLEEASVRLKPKGVYTSIDVFGLTTTVTHDMGIGQKILEMAKWVDYVCPMVYPSHYAPGEYGIAEPNKEPYRIVFLSLSGAKKRMGEMGSKLRPYLQDFTMGHRYGAKEVRDQIQATYDCDIGEWLLWNPRAVYTKDALKPKENSKFYEKSKKQLELEEKNRIASESVAASTATAAPSNNTPASPQKESPKTDK